MYYHERKPQNIKVLGISKGCVPRFPYTKVRYSFFGMMASPGEQHPSLRTCLINGVISCCRNLNGALTCKYTPILKELLIKYACFFSSRWPQTAGWHLGMTVTLFTRFYQTRFVEFPQNRSTKAFSNVFKGNWFSQIEKPFWTELLYKNIFPLDDQTSLEKSTSQPVDLLSAWPEMKPWINIQFPLIEIS